MKMMFAGSDMVNNQKKSRPTQMKRVSIAVFAKKFLTQRLNSWFIEKKHTLRLISSNAEILKLVPADLIQANAGIVMMVYPQAEPQDNLPHPGFQKVSENHHPPDMMERLISMMEKLSEKVNNLERSAQNGQ